MQSALPCLCYHSIGTPDGHSIETFEAHLRYLHDHRFKTLTAKQLFAIVESCHLPANQKSCVLTFDDCHLSNWLYAIPLLKKYNMHGIFFCVTDLIDFSSSIVRRESGNSQSDTLASAFTRATQQGDLGGFMNLGELKSSVDDFGMDVFSHSAAHKPCIVSIRKAQTPQPRHWSVPGLLQSAGITLPDEYACTRGSAYANKGIQLSSIRIDGDRVTYAYTPESERQYLCEQDFKKSHDIIREINRAGADQFFCYPWGQHDELTRECLKKTGYKGAFILSNDQNVPPIDGFAINRFSIGPARKLPFFMFRVFMQTNKHVHVMERFLRSLVSTGN